MNKYVELLLGIVLLVVGVWGIAYFAPSVLELIKGVWGIFVAFIGLIFLILGVTDLKE